MHLDKLEIKGFKSFRDKTVLEFPDKFTAIVGPNGSGKSNIIDSIYFVLGRSRGLRASNASELICNGGIGNRESQTAKVTLFLSNGNGEKKKISREIDRTGKSIYRIDDKINTRQQVINIMGDNEYNIILQNDVNRVIEMKPRERRKIIDDICGIAEYDQKKDKAINELKQVEAKINDLQIIIGEKRGYLGELGKEREDALRYQDLRDRLKKGEASILHLELDEYSGKDSELESKIESLKTESREIVEKITGVKANVAEKNTRLREINSMILELEEKRGASRLIELKTEITRTQDRSENLESKRKTLETEIGEKGKKRESHEKEDARLEVEINKIAEKLVPLKEKIDKESSRLEDARLDKALDEQKTRIFDVKSQIATLNDIARRDSGEVDALSLEKEALDAKVKELLASEKDLARNIDDGMIKNRSSFEEYEKLKTDLPKIETRHRAVSKELEKVQIEYAEKKSELRTIEKTTNNLGNSVAAVMKLRSIVPGIYGTVSQLGCVSDPAYEKALEIAAGGRMQNVVVEDEDVAAKCIDYLKKKKIGRATFLPLSKIKASVSGEAPGNSIGFARDYITTPYKFEKIFEYVYGDTVLVKDLNAAKKVGIGKWRMVTTDGDLVSREGAMVGGYVKKDVSIKFSSTEELEGELAILEKKIIALDGERQELDLKKVKIEERLNALEGSVSGGKTDIEKIRLEKEALSEKREEIKERNTAIDARIKELKKKVAEAERTSKKLEGELEVDLKKLEKLQKKAPEMDTGLLDKLREDFHKKEIEKGRLEEKREMLKKQVLELAEDVKALQEQYEIVGKELTEAGEKLSVLSENLQVEEGRNRELTSEIEGLVSEKKNAEEDINKVSVEVSELETRVGRINQELSRCEIERAKVETRLADLREEYTSYEGTELIEEMKLPQLRAMVTKISSEVESFGSVNMRSIESYETLKNELDEFTEKLDTLKNERQSIYDFMDAVEQKKRDTFMKTFEVVRDYFENIFAEISEGEGTLILDNPRDLSNSGLIITASPKGKKLMNIDLMSGGEKVLTTSAFLLAIQRYKPSHFYIVDELDAALDRENSAKLADMLSKTEAQFLMITHNNTLMKYAESVLGISMIDGISQVVGVKLT